MGTFWLTLVLSVIYFSVAKHNRVNGALSEQEKISQNFFQKFNLPTFNRRKNTGNGGNVGNGKLNHLYTWQNMFHAANDAFRIFKNFDQTKVKNPSTPLRRKIPNTFQPKDFFNVGEEENMIDEKSRANVSFKSFEAVPAINKDIKGDETKTTLRQILETTTATTTTVKEANSNPLLNFIYALGSDSKKDNPTIKREEVKTTTANTTTNLSSYEPSSPITWPSSVLSSSPTLKPSTTTTTTTIISIVTTPTTTTTEEEAISNPLMDFINDLGSDRQKDNSTTTITR